MRNDYRGEAIPLKISAPIAVSRPVSSRPRADAAPLRLPMPGETIMPDHRKERALDAAQTDRFIAQGFIHIDYAQEPFRRGAAPIRRSRTGLSTSASARAAGFSCQKVNFRSPVFPGWDARSRKPWPENVQAPDGESGA
ncbi:MAG: hypothetical protein ACOZAM_28510 [Pseudomonadota bacterium]